MHLNKLLCVSTHASGIRLLSPSGMASTSASLTRLTVELRANKMEPPATSTSASKLLQVLLAAWVPS
jgi:hypothetical protein